MLPDPDAPGTLSGLLRRAAGFPAAGLRILDRRERPRWESWPEIHAAARAVAGSLGALGVEPGDRVAVVHPTGFEFFHAFFGALLAGAVPVPLYPPARLGRRDGYRRRTAAMLRAAGVRLLLAGERLRRPLEPAVAAAAPALGCRTLGDLPAAEGAEVEVASSSLGLVQFSSGTTADPKPVALTHRALLAQVRALNARWPDPPGAVEPARAAAGEAVKHSGVSWLPLYHDMGLIGCVFTALERPGTLTLFAPEVFVARPAAWLRAISRYRATLSVAPNFAYGLCAEKIREEELDGVDLGRWRVALCGAEPVAPSVLAAFRRRFAPWGFRPAALTPVYGLAEAALAVTFSDLAKEPGIARFDRRRLAEGRARLDPEGVELASVGRPLPGFEVRVVDGRGRPQAAGRVGRVEVRGPSLMEGYLGRPDLTAEVLRGGWLDTGDLGFLHRGELFLTSRAKDVVILRGRNHSPVEIEQAAGAVAGVRRDCAAAVSWLPEGAPGEVLVVFVEHRRGAPAETVAGLPAACAEAVLAATGLRPDEVVVLAPGSLPRTSSGKLRRRETLRRHLERIIAEPRSCHV